MNTPPISSPPASSRRFPVWLILLLVGGILALIFCAIVGVGLLTLLGKRVEAPKQITATDGQSVVTVPGSWSKMTDLHDSAELQAGNKLQGQYLVVLTESKTDLAMDLPTFAETVMHQLTGNVTSPQTSEPQSLSINGHPAIQYEIHAKVDDLNIVYWLTGIEGSKNYYQVLAWTTESKAAQNKPILQQVIQSFQEIVKQ